MSSSGSIMPGIRRAAQDAGGRANGPRGKTGARLEAAGSAAYSIPDGTVVPACAQACPAQAIIFGDLSDPNSRVAQTKHRTRNYELLGELGTRPRTSYQGRVLNPNPRLAATEVVEETDG